MPFGQLKDFAPTSDMYRFAALFGLGVMLVGALVYWPAYKGEAEASVALRTAEAQAAYYQKLTETLPLEVMRLEQDFWKTHDANRGFPTEEVLKKGYHISDIGAEMKAMDAAGDAHARLRDAQAQVVKYLAEAAVTRDTLEKATVARQSVFAPTLALLIVGGAISAAGFALWHRKIQRFADIKAELEGLKAAQELSALREELRAARPHAEPEPPLLRRVAKRRGRRT